MLINPMLFVEGHGFAAALKRVRFSVEDDQQFATCIIVDYSMDVLCLFGVAEGLYVPLKIRALRNGLFVEVAMPGVVETLEALEDLLVLRIKLDEMKELPI